MGKLGFRQSRNGTTVNYCKFCNGSPLVTFLDLSLKTFKRLLISNFRTYLLPNFWPQIRCWLSTIINTKNWIYKIFWSMPSIIWEWLLCLKTSFWRRTINDFEHFNNKCMYTVMVYRGNSFHVKVFQNLKVYCYMLSLNNIHVVY